jgi:prepilin-type N-terminal cleavage/methylation domain-containing protein
MSIKFSLAAQGGKHTKKKEGEAGFTLLEVLLALTLTGLLLVLLSPALFNMERFLFRSNATAELSRVQRLLYRRLAATLDNAYQYPFFDGNFPSFTGDERGFTVLTHSEEGLARTEYLLQGEELQLKIYYYQRDMLAAKPEEKGETIILAHHLANPSFAYLDETSGVWRSVWNEEAYPRLVRLVAGLRFESGDADDLVPVVVPLRIGEKYRWE